MPRTFVLRSIDAPVDRVFSTVADINQFSKAIPHIVKVEFLSELKSGVGIRFRETRSMKGKEVSNDLEVTEFVRNERVRFVSDSHGTIWDTVFAVKASGGQTVLTMTMETKTDNPIRRVMVYLISPMVKKAIEADMDRVKEFSERPG